MDWITHFGPPHLTWLVAALLVQRERQRWHHAVTREIRDEWDDDDEDGGRPLVGHPGWRFERHGSGMCLLGPDGEMLDVDFNDEDGAIIDVWFFARRVESLRTAPAWRAERRLWRWRPSHDLIVDGIDELVALGAASYATEYKNTIVLAPELETRARTMADSLRNSAKPWLEILEPGGEAAHTAAHRAWIHDRVRTSSRGQRFLDFALHDATEAETIDLCRLFLARDDWGAGRAIELLRARPAIPVLPEVAALVRRASLETDHPFASFHACAYLLERGVERELALERFDAWSALDKAVGYNANPMAANYAIFALQHLPDRAMLLVRRALRSAPICVREIAALLSVIDQVWCHRELAAALSEPEHESRAYLAAALRRTSSEIAKRRGELAPPARTPDAVGFTFEEVLHASADDDLRDEAEPASALASMLRDRYPADWIG